MIPTYTRQAAEKRRQTCRCVVQPGGERPTDFNQSYGCVRKECSTKRLGFGLIGVGVLLAALWSAAPASATTITSARIVGSSASFLGPADSASPFESNSSGAPSSVQSSLASSDVYSSTSLEAWATVGIGSMKLYSGTQSSATANSSVTGPSSSSYGLVDGFFEDTITLMASGYLAGERGHMSGTLLVDGLFSSIIDASTLRNARLSQSFYAVVQFVGAGIPGGAYTAISAGQGREVYFRGDIWGPPRNTSYDVMAPGVWPVETDFYFGIPFNVRVFGQIFSQAYASALHGHNNSLSEIVSIVDFGSTIKWGEITGVTDGSGRSVTDYTVTSDSGFDYTGRAVAVVPEPLSSVLVGLGLVVLSLELRSGRKTALPRACPPPANTPPQVGTQ